jgi:hypothetical protein
MSDGGVFNTLPRVKKQSLPPVSRSCCNALDTARKKPSQKNWPRRLLRLYARRLLPVNRKKHPTPVRATDTSRAPTPSPRIETPDKRLFRALRTKTQPPGQNAPFGARPEKRKNNPNFSLRGSNPNPGTPPRRKQKLHDRSKRNRVTPEKLNCSNQENPYLAKGSVPTLKPNPNSPCSGLEGHPTGQRTLTLTFWGRPCQAVFHFVAEKTVLESSKKEGRGRQEICRI